MRTPAEQLAQLKAQQLHRQLKTRARRGDAADGATLVSAESAETQPLLNFSSNDYLGLAREPALAEAIARGAREHGAGAAASRLLSGSLPVHEQAEQAIANCKQVEAALLFSSGYAAAVGAVSSLVDAGDFILLDRLAHASLIDGAKLSKAPFRPFRHNDVEHLRALLVKARGSLSAQARILVIAESAYSMDGDLAPVAELHALCAEFDALLLLDEAHALGVLGPQGRGLAGELDLAGAENLIQLGTLSKAAGLQGGFLAGSQLWMELILNRARSFVYSTAVLPALAAAVPTALNLLSGTWGEGRRERLWQNLAQVAQQLGFAAPASAILPLPVGAEKAALEAAARLEERGILIPAVRYPTVGKGQARLRLTLSAAHSPAQVGQLLRVLQELELKGTSKNLPWASTYPFFL